ncbi:hypothetical protein GOV04_05035 [Candidatus Woesearchaeota archaeon]|nr:hypothetical protein [Candidatus Woesearchaeota archaeon]
MGRPPSIDYRDKIAKEMLLNYSGKHIKTLKVPKVGVTTSLVKNSIELNQRIVLVSPTKEILEKTERVVNELLGKKVKSMYIHPNLGNIKLIKDEDDYDLDYNELKKSLCKIKVSKVLRNGLKFSRLLKEGKKEECDKLKKLHHLEPIPQNCKTCKEDCKLNQIVEAKNNEEKIDVILITYQKLDNLLSTNNKKLQEVLELIFTSDNIILDEFTTSVTKTDEGIKLLEQPKAFDKTYNLISEAVEQFKDEIGLMLDEDIKNNNALGEFLPTIWYLISEVINFLQDLEIEKHDTFLEKIKEKITDEEESKKVKTELYEQGMAYLVKIIKNPFYETYRIIQTKNKGWSFFKFYELYFNKGKNVELLETLYNLLDYEYFIIEKANSEYTIKDINTGYRDFLFNLQLNFNGQDQLLAIVDAGMPKSLEFLNKFKEIEDYEVGDPKNTQKMIMLVCDDIDIKSEVGFIKKRGRQENIIDVLTNWATIHKNKKGALITKTGYEEVPTGHSPFKIAQVIGKWFKEGRISRESFIHYYFRDIYNRGTDFPFEKQSIFSMGLPYPPTNIYFNKAIVKRDKEGLELVNRYGSSDLFRDLLKDSESDIEDLELIPTLNKILYDDNVSSSFNNYILRNKTERGNKRLTNFCLLTKYDDVIKCLKNGYDKYPMPVVIKGYSQGDCYKDVLMYERLFQKYGDVLNPQHIPLLARIIRRVNEKKKESVNLFHIKAVKRKSLESEEETELIKEVFNSEVNLQILKAELKEKYFNLRIKF